MRLSKNEEFDAHFKSVENVAKKCIGVLNFITVCSSFDIALFAAFVTGSNLGPLKTNLDKPLPATQL
jgi:hypothetical protein